MPWWQVSPQGCWTVNRDGWRFWEYFSMTGDENQVCFSYLLRPRCALCSFFSLFPQPCIMIPFFPEYCHSGLEPESSIFFNKTLEDAGFPFPDYYLRGQVSRE